MRMAQVGNVPGKHLQRSTSNELPGLCEGRGTASLSVLSQTFPLEEASNRALRGNIDAVIGSFGNHLFGAQITVLWLVYQCDDPSLLVSRKLVLGRTHRPSTLVRVGRCESPAFEGSNGYAENTARFFESSPSRYCCPNQLDYLNSQRSVVSS